MKVKKNGTDKGMQRYLCKDCGKAFRTTNNTIFYYMRKDYKKWQTYIHCFVEKYPLIKTAEICGISLRTAFLWKHINIGCFTKYDERN